MKKYYFVSYYCKTTTTACTQDGWYFILIDRHPLRWQIESIKNYNKQHIGEGYAEITIISWQKLTKKEYEEFIADFISPFHSLGMPVYFMLTDSKD